MVLQLVVLYHFISIVAECTVTDMRSMKMTVFKDQQYRCTGVYCQSFFSGTATTLRQCQMLCLSYEICCISNFYTYTQQCELFGDIPTGHGEFVSRIDSTALLVIRDTRLPPGKYLTQEFVSESVCIQPT